MIWSVDVDEYVRMADESDRHWWFEATRALLEQFMGPYLPSAVSSLDETGPLFLDAGGGTGATGGWMAARGRTVIADLDGGSLVVAAGRIDGIQPVRAELDRLPHPDDTFDAVLCVTVLCHHLTPDPGVTVRELARVTRPGGVVCLLEPGVKRLRRGHDRITHTARRFSLAELRQLVVGAGMQPVRSTAAYSFLVPPAALMAVVERGRSTSDVGRNQSGLGGSLGALAKLERAWLRRWNLPAGLSVLTIGRKPG